MKELLSDVIYKYTGIKADSKENLLDLPIIRVYCKQSKLEFPQNVI